jgi:hypothetical protein
MPIKLGRGSWKAKERFRLWRVTVLGRMKWNFGYYLRAYVARVNTDSYTTYHGRQCFSCVGILSMPGAVCGIPAVT